MHPPRAPPARSVAASSPSLPGKPRAFAPPVPLVQKIHSQRLRVREALTVTKRNDGRCFPINAQVDVADAVMKVRARNTPYGLRPKDPGVLESFMALAKELKVLGTNARSAGTYGSHWKRWVAFCDFMGTSEWRDDREANLGVDATGYHNEVVLLCAAYLFAMTDMKGRKRAARGEAQPESGRNFLRSVRAVHAKQTPRIDMVPISVVSDLYTGLMRPGQICDTS